MPRLEFAKDAMLITLIFASVLGALGVFSLIMWQLPIWTHILVWFVLSIALAICIVKLLESARLRLPTTRWVIGLAVMLTLFLSMADIIVSGLKWTGAWVPIEVPEMGLIGGTGAGTMVLSILGGPLFGALVGHFLSLHEWEWRKIATGIAIAIIAVLMVLIVI